MKKHIHYDAIIAFANGAQLQCFDRYYGIWKDIPFPCFSPLSLYRVKPEREFPTTSLLGTELLDIYMTDSAPDRAAALKAVANAAIKQYILDTEKEVK